MARSKSLSMRLLQAEDRSTFCSRTWAAPLGHASGRRGWTLEDRTRYLGSRRSGPHKSLIGKGLPDLDPVLEQGLEIGQVATGFPGRTGFGRIRMVSNEDAVHGPPTIAARPIPG